MGTRVKVFELGEQRQSIGFGTYALILFYAKQISENDAKKFFECTISEYYYRVYNDIPTGTVDDNTENVHFIISDIQSVINFLNGDVIPMLENEEGDLLEKYGGKNDFFHLFNADNQSFIREISIEKSDFFYSDPEDLIDVLTKLISFLQTAVTLNQLYKVYFD